MNKVMIAGTGSYLPEKILTNADLERMVETSDEWIITRTGIRERRICPPEMATSDLATEAAKRAMADAGVTAADIDGLICATITPDKQFPSTACLIQNNLELPPVPCFDISAACSGFIYALEIARNFIRNGTCGTMLVIAAETMSRVTDYTDRSTCILLGDGAGAAVVRRSERGHDGILGSHLAAAGKYAGLLHMPAGGSRMPASRETVEKRLHFMKMEGAALFKIAVQSMVDAASIIIRKAGLKIEDVSLVIPHQANLRIINSVMSGIGLPPEKVFVNIEKYGNMSAACIPIALDEAVRSGRVKPGDIILTVAFGAGLTWGANLIRWGKT